MVLWTRVNIGSGYGLLPDGNKPLPEPMLTQGSRVLYHWSKGNNLNTGRAFECYHYKATMVNWNLTNNLRWNWNPKTSISFKRVHLNMSSAIFPKENALNNGLKFNGNFLSLSWWRHQMETFSAWLALCEANPPVTGGFPSQCPMTRCFDVFFDLRLNKGLSKQSRRWWFETPSRSLWRQCNVIIYHPQNTILEGRSFRKLYDLESGV